MSTRNRSAKLQKSQFSVFHFKIGETFLTDKLLKNCPILTDLLILLVIAILTDFRRNKPAAQKFVEMANPFKVGATFLTGKFFNDYSILTDLLFLLVIAILTDF